MLNQVIECMQTRNINYLINPWVHVLSSTYSYKIKKIPLSTIFSTFVMLLVFSKKKLVYIYIAVIRKRYTSIDLYRNILFPWSNRNGFWYEIDSPSFLLTWIIKLILNLIIGHYYESVLEPPTISQLFATTLILQALSDFLSLPQRSTIFFHYSHFTTS